MESELKRKLSAISIEEEKNKRIRNESILFVKDNTTLLDILVQAIFDGIAFFFVTLSIYLTDGDATKFIFAFWTIFMVFGPISGAHINAVVTVSLWIYNGKLFTRDRIMKLILYLIFQFLGILLAVLFARFLSGFDHPVIVNPKELAWYKLFFTEAFFSGTLVFVALYISSGATQPTDKNYINLTILSIWLFLIIMNGSKISGGNYNPTVYLVLNGFAAIVDGKSFNGSNFAIMMIAPFVGGIIFTLMFKYFFRPYYIRKHSNVIQEIDKME